MRSATVGIPSGRVPPFAFGMSCPFRKSYPDVLVVQPGQDWDGDNDTGPLDPAAFEGSGLSMTHTAEFYSAPISSSLVLISGLSCKTTFNKELWTSSFPLYSMKPNLRNLFMKKLTRDRVVPIISASVS